MTLFGLFSKKRKLNDPFFGDLREITFKDKSKNYFEGKGIFSPTNSEIEYSIEKEMDDPTNWQKEFYEEIQKSYNELVLKIVPIVLNEYKKVNKAFQIEDFAREFTLVGLTIPKSTERIWDMSFETIHDLDHQIIINFENFEVKSILIDG